MTCFIGLDIGTSSTKAVLVDVDGNVLADLRQSHPVLRARPGWAEHDPERHWWDDAVTLVRRLLDTSGIKGENVAAIGCSGVCPVVLPVDEEGTPLRPAILYSIDSRAIGEARELERRLGEAVVRADSGQPLSSQSVVPKLLWLRRHEPDVWVRTRKVLGATGYLVYRLSGEMVVDHFTAGDGGLGYVLSRGEWNDDLLEEIGLSAELFPDLAWPTDVVGRLQPEAAEALRLPPGIPVIAGTGDALAEMIAAGVQRVGETALLYGSTMTTMTLIDEPWLHDGFITVPGWQPDTLITSAVLGTGAELLNWWSRVIDRPMDADLMHSLNAAAGRVAPGADGLTVLPYLTGERSPNVNPDLRGAFLGLQPGHGPGHFVRALMEGAALALRLCLEELPSQWRPRRVFAAGGGTASREFLQIVSDACGMEQHVCNASVSAAMGSAWLAAVGVGALQDASGAPKEQTPSLQTWAGMEASAVPDRSRVEVYDELYKRFLGGLQTVERFHS